MDSSFALDYRELEKNHWWFRAQRDILKQLIAPASWPAKAKVLEIGVGSGENLYSLYPPETDLTGIEPYPENAEFASQKGSVPVHVGTAETFPEKLDGQKFDVITMFDVLEHTKDDELVLRTLHNKLNTSGRLIMSVPAYMWLWGRQDLVSHHYRRYTMGELTRKLKVAGFGIEKKTYFNTLLLPVIATIRVLGRPFLPKDNAEVKSDFAYKAGFANELFYRIFRSTSVRTFFRIDIKSASTVA